MATLHEKVKTLITSATIAVLTGGVFDAEDTKDSGNEGGGMQWARDEGLFDASGLIMTPHAKIRWHESNAYQANSPKLRAEQEFFEVYIYQDAGYAVIDSAMPLIKDALHDLRLSGNLDDCSFAHILFGTRSLELQAEEYSNRPTKFMRFSINQRR